MKIVKWLDDFLYSSRHVDIITLIVRYSERKRETEKERKRERERKRETEKEKEREKQRERETENREKQRNRETEKQRNRETEKKRERESKREREKHTKISPAMGPRIFLQSWVLKDYFCQHDDLHRHENWFLELKLALETGFHTGVGRHAD